MTLKPRLSLAFVDFWDGFDAQQNYFTRLLSQHYDVRLSGQPDLLIYSCFGRAHRQFDCIRVFYTGENVRPDFTICDYALSFDHLDHPRHCRLPLYVLECDPKNLLKPNDFDPAAVLRTKTRFCNFVYGNSRCPPRNHFFRKLSEYKRVDSGGRLMNNMGRVHGNAREKLMLIADYKFTIAFENCSQSGYTTEKIIHPMLAGSLPIYWGNPLVHLDFNPDSFVNYFDYDSVDRLIDRIIEIDHDDELFVQYMGQPWFQDNRTSHWFDPARILGFFEQIISSRRIPIAVSGRYNVGLNVRRAKQRLARNASRIWRDGVSRIRVLGENLR